MSNKKFAILGLVTLVIVILTVIQSKISSSKNLTANGPIYLMQGLDPESVNSIQIGTGKDMVTFNRQENQFVVANMDGYPAKIDSINKLITNCLEVKVNGIYTNNKDNHKDLQLTADKAPTLIRFIDQQGQLITGLIIGKRTEQGSFVRLINSDNVYLTQNTPWISNSAITYVKRDLISAPSENIEYVTVDDGKDKYKLTISEDNVPQIDPMPEVRKIKGTEYKSVFDAFRSLSFDNANLESSINGLNFDKEVRCKLKDTTRYTIKFANKDEKNYIKISAEYLDQSPINVLRDGSESEEQLKEKEAKLLAKEAAMRFNQQHSGWIYEISQSSADRMLKSVWDITEQAPVIEPTEITEEFGPIAQPQ